MHTCSSEYTSRGTTLICLTVGLWLFDIFEGFCATSTTVAYIFHAYASHHLNCDECWRSTGFSYTIKIKPLHVDAVRATLRHVDHTAVKGSWKATRAGLTCSFCSLKATLCQTLYVCVITCTVWWEYKTRDVTRLVTCSQTLSTSCVPYFPYYN